MKKYGFTLVELLAVMVILAIILAIAIPSISKITKGTTKSAFASDAKMVLKQLDYEKLKDSNFDVTTVSKDTITDFNLSNANYDNLIVGLVDNDPYIIILGKGKWEGLKACGTIRNITIADVDNTEICESIPGPTPTYYDVTKGVNKPQLAQGMIPIKWDGTDWIDTTAADADWYNYDTTDKKWANAKTADGSMWVWIPRYAYQIASGYHTNTAGTINVKFLIDKTNTTSDETTIELTPTYSGSSQTNYIKHSAFTFGTIELAGIWVAKFDPTAVEGVANGYVSDSTCPTVGDNVTTKIIKVLPNVRSWRCISVGNAFTAIRNMETNSAYGWSTASGLQADGTFAVDDNNIDTHLMKNTEWGAIAYLSKSQYGKNTEEIYLNNNRNYITGCAGSTVSAAGYNGCQNTYSSVGGVKASATGNIYGLYDLSGSAWKRVAAYVNNGHSNLNTHGSSIISADSRYKNVYTVGGTDDQATNYGLAIDIKGDAIYEISSNINGTYSWFADYSYTPNTSNPWFVRGSAWLFGSKSGVFAFHNTTGSEVSSIDGFRPILLVDVEL